MPITSPEADMANPAPSPSTERCPRESEVRAHFKIIDLDEIEEMTSLDDDAADEAVFDLVVHTEICATCAALWEKLEAIEEQLSDSDEER